MSTRYLSVWYDTNGVGHLVGGLHDFPDEDGARDRIAEVLAQQRKEHKIDYRVVSYPKGQQYQVMEQLKIMG